MIDIRLVDPAAPDMRPLLEAHLAHSESASPKESNHALDVAALRSGEIQFWALFDEDEPLGCGAIKPLPDGSAEVKSVHVAERARGRGFARRMMEHLAEEARVVGHTALVLETGSELCAGYEAARSLYEALGYSYCGPISGYSEDPNSVFMRLPLDSTS